MRELVVRNHMKRYKKAFRDYQCAQAKFASRMLKGLPFTETV